MTAHCPECNGEHECIVHGEVNVLWEWIDGRHSVNGQTDHRLLQCQGCKTRAAVTGPVWLFAKVPLDVGSLFVAVGFEAG